jgi:serine/threonine-protein kinase
MILASAHAGQLQRTRFQIEAEAVARLQHPNIVQIYEVGEQEGLPYFSLEFVDGGPLDKKITGIPQPPREAAQLVETLCRAMHFAHEQGIIHRDLKPANILMTQDGVPKITDFGLAKLLEEETSSQTKSGTIMGTPSYMAPEQARGEVRAVGPHSDLYTLGAILYELLTGRPPFHGANPMDTVMQVTRDEPIPPSRLQPKTPRDLETICLKCLQKEPAKRYANCFELAMDLHRYLAGEPIQARPVGNVERLWRWCKRNPRLAGAAAAIFLLLLVVCIGSTWAAFTIRAQKKLAEDNEQKAIASEKIAQEQRALAQENEKKALASEKVAEDQAELALSTLGLLINKVQSQLNKQPGAGQLKHELLETAMNGLKRVTGGASGKTRRYTSDAYLKMGFIARELGNTAEAFDYWNQFYELAQSAMKDNADNERLKLEMAWACRSLGEISTEMGDLKKALTYYQRALELRKELAAVPLAERRQRNAKLSAEDRLTPSMSQLQLSEDYTRVGLIHYFQGESAQAEEPVLKSLGIRENLLKDFAWNQAVWFMTANPQAGPATLTVVASVPNQVEQIVETRQNLARNYHLLGEIYFRLKKLDQSRVYYQKCEDVREAILRDDEEDVQRLKQIGKARAPDYRLMGDLAEFQQMYGGMLLALGAPLADALPHIDRAIELSRRVLEIDKSAEPQQNLAKSLYARGVVAARGGDRVTAGKCFDECLEIREALAAKDARSYRKKLDLLVVLARVGKHPRAAQLAEQLRSGHEKNTDFLIHAARCYAQCALAVPSDLTLRPRYLELALAALQSALKNGYKDIIVLETNPDLDPIRGSAAFKKMIDEVK